MALRLHRLHALLTPNVSRNPKKNLEKTVNCLLPNIQRFSNIIRRKATFSWTCTFHSRNQRNHESSELHYGYCPINIRQKSNDTHTVLLFTGINTIYFSSLFTSSFTPLKMKVILSVLFHLWKDNSAICQFPFSHWMKRIKLSMIIWLLMPNEVPTVIHFL